MTLKGTQFHFRKSGNHTIIHNPSTSLFPGVYTCPPGFYTCRSDILFDHLPFNSSWFTLHCEANVIFPHHHKFFEHLT